MEHKKKVYIAGCGGMLGDAFYQIFDSVFEGKYTDKDVNSDWLEYLDFRDAEAYKKDVKRFSPDLLIHLGALTDLEYCELNSQDAWDSNTGSVMTAVQIANALEIPILYISTAGIFDGAKDSYDEYDHPIPLGVYGKTKYAGERYVLERAKKPFVMRAGWMMGGGLKDKKFVAKICKQILNGSTELFVVDDKDGTPTYTLDFAAVALKLVSTEYYGLYNCVCQGFTSRVDVAKKIVELSGEDITVHPVGSDYFSEQYFAERPRSESLVNRGLDILRINSMKPWQDSIEEYVPQLFEKLAIKN